jgi:hypothetical protein
VPSGPVLNYTTTIAVTKTAAECSAILARSGATSVSVHYEDGEPAGLSFSLKTPHGARDFTLPVNVTGVRDLLVKADKAGELRSRPKGPLAVTSREHAARVAWRVLKDWLEAQLALIAARMVSIDEVFLPWLQVSPDKTLYAAYREREATLELTAGTDG